MRYVCGWCGSDQVTRDAWAEWDAAARRWVLGAVFDDSYGHRCEAERSIEEAAAADVDVGVVWLHIGMKISFDPVKREAALRDRGLDFAEAGTLFAGPVLTLVDDRFDYPEARWQTYGWLGERLVLMVWTPADDGVRVISMRYCHGKEQRRIAPRMG